MSNYPSDVYTMTPGSAVADQLSDILTKKRVEARQNMLDRLNMANTQSEMAYRDENAKSLAQQRDARAQEMKSLAEEHAQKMNLGKLGAMTPGNVSGGQRDFLANNFPNLLQESGGATLPSTQIGGGAALPNGGAPSLGAPPAPTGPGMGLGQPTQSPSVPDASVPTTSTFLGTQEQQNEKQLSQLGSNQDFQHADPLTKWGIMRALLPHGEAPPANLVTKPEKANTPIFTMDRGGHVVDTGQSAPPGSHFMTQPAPPPAEGWNAPQLYQGSVPDPNDPTKQVPTSYWLRPGEQPSDKNKIITPLIKGNPPKPAANKNTNPLYDDKAFNELQKEMTKKGAGGAAAKENAITAFVDKLPDPAIKADIKAILARAQQAKKLDPNSTISVEEVMKDVTPPQLITGPNGSKRAPSPEEQQKFLDNVATILRIVAH